MPTTNTNFSTLISAIDTRAQSLASNGEAKDLVYLGKAIEALNIPSTVSDVIAEGDTQVAAVTAEGTTQLGLITTEGTAQVTAVTNEGTTQVAAVQSAASGFATQADIDTSVAALVDSAPATLDTLNELAAALGDDPNFSTTVTNNIASKLPVTGGTMTGGLTAPSVTVDGTLDIEEVYEAVALNGNTSGTITFDTTAQGILYFVNNQTANRTANFTNVNANLGIGQSVTCTLLCDQGSTAYYLDGYQVDGTPVTVKWQGGSAPTGGNASGIDVYTFTIIKTADATFTVLASQTQYA